MLLFIQLRNRSRQGLYHGLTGGRWPIMGDFRACVGFVVDKVAVGQVFLRVFRFFPVSIIPPVIHAYSSIHLQLCIILKIDSVSNVKWPGIEIGPSQQDT